MPSVVTAFQPLAGDRTTLLRVFGATPGAWLPDARREAEVWALPVHAGALSHLVALSVGEPWRVGSTTWRSLSWDPHHADPEHGRLDRLLPSLDGELALHLAGERATLVLEARYQPPGGALGAAVDAVALHRVARATVERLLAGIAGRLSELAEAEAPESRAGVC